MMKTEMQVLCYLWILQFAITMRPSMRHKLLFIRDLHNFCNAEAFLRISTLNVNAKRKHKYQTRLSVINICV